MKKYSKAVGPKLYPVLVLVLGLTTLLTVNSLYLSVVTFYEWFMDTSIQDRFYLWMFLLHLILGIALIAPFIIYAIIHARNTRSYRNKTAKRAGYIMLISAIVLLVTGILLTRFSVDFEIINSQYRSILYWLHVLLPVVYLWLFVLHRLSGRPINLKPGKWILVVALLGVVAYIVHQKYQKTGPIITDLLAPAFSTTRTGDFMGANQLNNNEFCVSCHEDFHNQWLSSAHRFSSFNNVSYAFSVNNTKAALLKREGHSNDARLCASCHDPVLFFSGQFDDLTAAEQMGSDAQAGITCSSCHLIDAINSHKGNGAFQIAAPTEYPLTHAETEPMKWVNQLLIKSKPDNHKATYLKPLHGTAEFCSTCHKVSLPESLNDYRWLRGQNHYDSFLLSGVSGHKVTSFYYPKEAKEACQDCHMQASESNDISAKYDAESGQRFVSNHAFDVANTAIRYLNDVPLNENSSKLLKNSVGIDLLSLKSMQENDSSQQINHGQVLSVESGRTYQLDAVLKTQTLGHAFTQGTADSNQIWMELAMYQDDQLIALNGGLNDQGVLDPFAYHVNAYVIDKDGNRIMMRNPEDIFATLYSHQIPPGAAAVIHYQVDVPPEVTGQIRIEAKLYYRKFHTTYYRAFMDDPNLKNDLPVVMIGENSIEFDVDSQQNADNQVIQWQRWNDYGIALMRGSEYKQAIDAFEQVVKLGRAEGLINLVRVHLKEGQLELAQEKLTAAQANKAYPYPWHFDYFTGKLHFLNGRLEQAINSFHQVLDSNYPEAREANFDFSKDYEFLTEVAQTYLQLALTESQSSKWYNEAEQLYKQILTINSEWADAYYGLFRIAKMTGDDETANQMEKMYQLYKIDDQNKSHAIHAARSKDPAADKASNRVVIYPVQGNQPYPLTLEQYQAITDITIL